jgi:hypothetical protein
VNASTKMTVEDLKMLISMLEMDMWENRRVQSLLDTLDSEPEELLPHAMGLVAYVSFLLTKVDRNSFALRTLLACLAWCIESGVDDEHGPTLIENIKYILKRDGLDLDDGEIRQRAIERDYGNSESWVHRFKSDSPSIPQELHIGIGAGVSSKLPLTTFNGWLKRLDPGVLNASGRALMREVFSRFDGSSSPEQHIQETERLVSLGVRYPQRAQDEIIGLRQLLDAGVEVQIRRHRRYAGGDGRLPRSCYSAVCSNAEGDDGGTLNRELMEYVHPCIPGTIFVGDSSDSGIKEILDQQGIGMRPGYCALCVFIFAPEDSEDRKVFNAVYSQTLEHSGGPDTQVHLIIIETRVDPVEIDNVLDLRLPETQAWFFNRFKCGDGVHLRKPNGEQISNFCDMLPTLMHPELGGCDTTHGIGSWMRTSPVNALIYPSARSDAEILIRDGQLVGFSGWNMVDYRGAAEIASGEIVEDYAPWSDFNQLGMIFNRPEVSLYKAPTGSSDEGSWVVRGIQARYDYLYQQIIG